MSDLLKFRANIVSKVERRELNGSAFIVAPVIALVEGVMNNELVPAEEFGRFVGAWNGIPIPIGHPTQRGAYVSANRLDVANVGRFYNAEVKDGKLKGELWLDESALAATEDGREIKRKLEANELIEISTAYWRDLEHRGGTFKGGARYAATARNLRPDHLALLLHKAGSCSILDGCGAPRANEDGSQYIDISDQDKTRTESDGEIEFCLCGGKDHETDEQRISAKDRDNNAEVLTNRIDQLAELIRKFIGGIGDSSNKEKIMNELIDGLVDNERNKFSREELEAMDESTLKTLSEMLVEDEAEEEEEQEGEENESEEDPEDEKPPEMPDWAQTLVDDMSAVKTQLEGISTNEKTQIDAARAEIIDGLIANDSCSLSKTDLDGFDLEQLQKLEVAFMPADFSGRGGARRTEGELIAEYDLPMPIAD